MTLIGWPGLWIDNLLALLGLELPGQTFGKVAKEPGLQPGGLHFYDHSGGNDGDKQYQQKAQQAFTKLPAALIRMGRGWWVFRAGCLCFIWREGIG